MSLNTQVSDYDSALTCFFNALKCLYKRDEIPLKLIKIICKYTLCYKPKIIGECATSKNNIKKVCKKIKKYAFRHNFDIYIKYYFSNKIDNNIIKHCINNKGVVIVKYNEDYKLIIFMDSDYYYMYDPSVISNKIYNVKKYISDSHFDEMILIKK